MRSRTNCIITSGKVYSWCRKCLLQAKLVKDHGWLCSTTVVLGVVLRFKRMLDWIVHEVETLYHDGSTPYVERPL